MGMPQTYYVHRFFACADPRRLLDGIGDGLDLRRGVALANNKVMTDCALNPAQVGDDYVGAFLFLDTFCYCLD